MKIEILCAPECPYCSQVSQLVQTAMRETGIEAEVEFLWVESEAEAQRLKFLGSPTVRVDGMDVETQANFGRHAFGLRCRSYSHDDVDLPYPPLEEIVSTLEMAYLAEHDLLGICC